jgi:hypothetical protein
LFAFFKKTLESLWTVGCGDFPGLDGMPLGGAVHNQGTDILAYAQNHWFEYNWYIDQLDDAADSNRELVR